MENLGLLLLLSPGKPRHWRRKWSQGVMQSPAEPGIISGVLSTPELAHSLPAPGRGGAEAMSREETRRAEQEVSALAWPARTAVGASG